MVLRSGEPVLYREVTDELLASVACDDEHLELLRSLDIRSTITVPLVGRGITLGALTFSVLRQSQYQARPYDDDDVDLAVELGRRAGVALANAQLFEREKELAATLQRSLLPSALPRIPGLDIAARFQPAGEGLVVGGDFYDIFAAGGGWAVTIGDVCGTGAEAAAVAAHVRYAIRAWAEDLAPATVLARVNASLLAESADLRFCTAVHGAIRVRPGGVGLTLCNAGHPPPLLARGGRIAEVSGGGPLLGVVAAPTFTEVDLDLEPGDTLVLYTDGVTEASGPDGRFGLERLRGALVTAVHDGAAAAADSVFGAVRRFTADRADDDRALVILRAGETAGPSL